MVTISILLLFLAVCIHFMSHHKYYFLKSHICFGLVALMLRGGGAINFSRWMEGGRSFFPGEGRGGRRIFQGRNESPGGRFF